MKLERAYGDFWALLVGISEEKVSGSFFRLRVAVGKKKVKKKKKILMHVFPCSFPFSGIKKGGKSKWLSFLRSEERENVK